MLDTLFLLTVVFGVMGLLLGAPFLLAKITKWELIEGHWWLITTGYINKWGRGAILLGFSGPILFYCAYSLFVDEQRAESQSVVIVLALLVTGVALVQFWKALRKNRKAQIHSIACVGVLSAILYALNLAPEHTAFLHVIAVGASSYMSWLLLVISAVIEKEAENA